MIAYLREYLIRIRRIENAGYMEPNLSTRFIITIVVGIISGVIIDIYLPYNFIVNMIRGLIAASVGVSFSSSLYLKTSALNRKRMIEDPYYVPFRKRIDFRQRANLSILIGAISTFILILVNSNGPAYTLFSSMYISIILTLTGFSRRDREEFIRDSYEMPNKDELEHMSEDVDS